MTKFNKKMVKQVEDTVKHRKYFFDSALLLFEMLIEIGKDDLALELMRRASVHDHSKFSMEEIEALSSVSEKQKDDDGFTNPDYKLNKEQENLISKHWANNRHHPEHFNSIYDMTTLDILEMICDWHARSVEFGTDLLEFVIHRQSNRFHLPSNLFDSIVGICRLLVQRKKDKDLKEGDKI